MVVNLLGYGGGGDAAAYNRGGGGNFGYDFWLCLGGGGRNLAALVRFW